MWSCFDAVVLLNHIELLLAAAAIITRNSSSSSSMKLSAVYIDGWAIVIEKGSPFTVAVATADIVLIVILQGSWA